MTLAVLPFANTALAETRAECLLAAAQDLAACLQGWGIDGAVAACLAGGAGGAFIGGPAAAVLGCLGAATGAVLIAAVACTTQYFNDVAQCPPE